MRNGAVGVPFSPLISARCKCDGDGKAAHRADAKPHPSATSFEGAQNDKWCICGFNLADL